MNSISIPAHFDGVSIRLDEAHPLEPGANLLVTVLPESDEEREARLALSSQRLAAAYGDDELAYSLLSVREMNAEYARR